MPYIFKLNEIDILPTWHYSITITSSLQK